MTENGRSIIGKAILGVMGEVGYVQKEKTPGLKYSFAGEAALIAALRPSMVKHGIICYVSDLLSIDREQFTTTKGTSMNRATAHGVVRFMHPESGSWIDVHAMGEGMDAGDKAGNKAATGLLKYALRQTFLIETGDDPDKTPSDDLERDEQFVEDQKGQPVATTPKDAAKQQKARTETTKASADPTTRFWALANQLEWDKHKAADFLVLHDNDFAKAYAELEKQDGGFE